MTTAGPRQRLIAHLRQRLRTLPCALLGLGEALLACWPVLLFAALAPAGLALSGQGQDALLTAGASIGFLVSALLWLGTAAVALYAWLRLDRRRLSARPGPVRRYARDTAPQIVGIAYAFALPLLLRGTSTAIDLTPTIAVDALILQQVSVGFLLMILRWVGPLLAIGAVVATHFSRRGELPPSILLPLGLVAAVHVLAFLFLGDGQVVAHFLLLLATVAVANWLLAVRFVDGPEDQPQHRRPGLTVGVAAFYAAVLLGVAAWVAADPVARTRGWGPAEVMLFATLAWLCVGLLVEGLAWWLAGTRTGRASPLLPALVRLVLLVGPLAYLFAGSFNETAVRTLAREGAAREAPEQAPSLDAHVEAWLRARTIAQAPAPPYPVFLVTAEGGGIRAAYWTAGVLAALHDATPAFGAHVLALSGVSGGSVGASLYAALAASAADDAAVAPCRALGGLRDCAARIARADLLSAPVASMLLSEPLQRLTGLLGPQDRARTLEQSLEAAWRQALGDERLAQPFAGTGGGSMLVLPNATSAHDGRRVVLSALDARGALPAAHVLDARALPYSTAALVSARFPVISPVAVYAAGSSPALRIVDGGYSDNSGAATVAELLPVLARAAQRAGLRGRIRPVVIAIANSQPGEDRPQGRPGVLGALIDPVATLDAVRAATSQRYLAELERAVRAMDGEFLDGLRLDHGGRALPLGWALSTASADFIDARVREQAEAAHGVFEQVRALIGEAADGARAAAPAASAMPAAPPADAAARPSVTATGAAN